MLVPPTTNIRKVASVPSGTVEVTVATLTSTVSSSVMVTVAAVPSVTWFGSGLALSASRFTWNVSSPSTRRSSAVCTVIVCAVVPPAAKVSAVAAGAV